MDQAKAWILLSVLYIMETGNNHARRPKSHGEEISAMEEGSVSQI